MRNANGYGAVVKLSGKRRKPYAVRITAGWEQDGTKAKQKYTYVGYYATKAEAMKALADYNADPYDIGARKVTFGMMMDKWMAERFPWFTPGTQRNYKYAARILDPIMDEPMMSLQLSRLQKMFDECDYAPSIRANARKILRQLYEMAEKNEYIPAGKDRTAFLDLRVEKKAKRPHHIFTAEEIADLWAGQGRDSVDFALIMIYSGCRISELLGLKWEHIDLNEQSFTVTEAKTTAGIRTAPIADKALPLWQGFRDRYPDSVYLWPNRFGGQIDQGNFRREKWPCPEHTPHDARHTCISMLVAAGVDTRMIQAIVGHSGRNVTEKVYTHISVKDMLEAINRI